MSNLYTTPSEPTEYADLIVRVEELSEALSEEKAKRKRLKKKIRTLKDEISQLKGEIEQAPARSDMLRRTLDSLPAALGLADTLMRRRH